MAEAHRSLWHLVDRAPELRSATSPRRFAWVPSALPTLVALSAVALGVMLPATLPVQARLALFAFGAAAVLWTTTRLNAAYVAVGAVLFLTLSGGTKQENLFKLLESDVIWLMIGAFVLGEAVRSSGLADRLTSLVCGGRRSVGSLMWMTTVALVPLTLLIPSTSGRAAVMLPLFHNVTRAANDPKVSRALALLIPCVILASTISALVGAGSHLIANDLLDEVSDRSIGFAQWLLYGLPFGIVASAAVCFVVSRMFLDRGARSRQIESPPLPRSPLSRNEKVTLFVAAGMVALWVTHARHGLEIATTSFLGAFVLMLPGLGVLSWKAGLKAVTWNLIFFVGAALVLGEALIKTGAAQWLIGQMFNLSGLAQAGSQLVLLCGLTLLTLTSHLYLTSHAARTAALVPPLLYLAQALQLNPMAVVFIATVGINYCMTFPVSSKALLMFQELDEPMWVPADLLKLSAVLLPVHGLLMVAFYYAWWRHVGLAL